MKSYLNFIITACLLSSFTLVQAAPNVSFTASTTSGIFPLAVNFNATASDSQSGTLQYFWTFGDGNQTNAIGSAGRVASNTYMIHGTFTVTLTVMNLSTFQTGTATKTIRVNVPTGTYRFPVDALHDAHLRNGASTNDGNFLKVGNGYVGYLKYNIPNLPGTITQAKLQLTYSILGGRNGAVAIAQGSNTNWTEGTLNNSNRPSNIENYGTINTNTSTMVYTKTITLSDVSEGGVLNLIISSNNSFVHNFTSSEGTFGEDRPKLVLTIDNSTSNSPTIQTGKVNVVTSNTTDWDQVTFPTPFSVTPIVVIGPPSFNGGNQSTTRVKNVTKTGFKVQVDEWDYLDGGHASETITYIAAKPGTHNLNGVKMRAGRVTAVDEQWKTANYGTTFSSTPVVMATQVSNAEGSATVIRLKGITSSRFQLRAQEEEANDDIHANETIHFMAFSKGTGKINGKNIKVADTGRSVQEAWKSISFGGTYSNAGFVAAMQTYYGADPCALRYTSLRNTSIKIKVEEEKSANTEVDHTTETVGYVVIANAAAVPAPNEDETEQLDTIEQRNKDIATPEQQFLKLYPNPTIDILYIAGADTVTEIKMYDMTGNLLATYKNAMDGLSVSHLQKGMYVLVVQQNGGQQTHRFIKR